MNVIIIEDEDQAAKRIEAILLELIPEAKVVATIDTVKKAVHFFTNNPAPDLALMDIQLADGISFEIFKLCEVKCPVIFTTAYDEYALKAFKVNSIDYILKPIVREELNQALIKFRSMSGKANSEKDQADIVQDLREVMLRLTKRYKTRFVIRVGEHLKTIDIDQIQYFVSQDKTTFCCTSESRKLILDYTLEQLEEMVDPQVFFRINRKYLVSSSSITDIIHYTNSRLKLILKNNIDNDVIVAREKVQDFKAWLDK
jgi:DNA-binding LytR/AlgR family response regulator